MSTSIPEARRRNNIEALYIISVIILFSTLLAGFVAYLIAWQAELDIYASIILGIKIGCIIAVVISAISILFSTDLLLIATHAYRVRELDEPHLHNWVKELSERLSIPTPDIFILPEKAINSLSGGFPPRRPFLALTRGARNNLDKEEQQALIAHELAHIARHDTHVLTIAGVLLGFFIVVTDYAYNNLLYLVKFKGFKFGFIKIPIFIGKVIAFGLTLLVFACFTPVAKFLLHCFISSKRELSADHVAIKLTSNLEAFQSASNKVAEDTQMLTYNNPALEHMFFMDTDVKKKQLCNLGAKKLGAHPSLEKRVKNLEDST